MEDITKKLEKTTITDLKDSLEKMPPRLKEGMLKASSKTMKDILKCQSIIRKKYWYLTILKPIIILLTDIYKRDEESYVYKPTLLGDDRKENIESLKVAFKLRQKQMKEGKIAQTLIGNWIGWEDLGEGHSSGLDCRKKDNSIIMEVKNKWNTCNSSSQKTLCDKLSEYKKENPETRCIWAIINSKPGRKKLSEKIIHNGVEIEKVQGIELLNLVFSIGKIDYSEQIINFVRSRLFQSANL